MAESAYLVCDSDYQRASDAAERVRAAVTVLGALQLTPAGRARVERMPDDANAILGDAEHTRKALRVTTRMGQRRP